MSTNNMRHLLHTIAASIPMFFLGACAVQAPPPPAPIYQPRPAEHPAYIHALSDLRAARWLIAHRPGNAQVSADEDVAITRINETIDEIKRAAIDDGKNIDDHPPLDQNLDRKGRLHHANDLLRKARSDIAREEDNGAVRGLRDRALRHLDAALGATQLAIRDASDGI